MLAIISYWLIELVFYLILFNFDLNLIQILLYYKSIEFCFLGTIISIILIFSLLSQLVDSYTKNIKQKLVDSKDVYPIISENANDLISIFDHNSKYEFINEKAHLNILGYKINDLIGKKPWRFIHPDDLKLAINTFNNSFRFGEGIIPLRFKQKNGNYLWIECKNKIFKDKKGIKKSVCISRDINERKLIEQELQDNADKMMIFNQIIMLGNKSEDLLLFLKNVLDSTLELMNFNVGSIYLIDTSKKIAELVCHRGLSDKFIETIKLSNITDFPNSVMFIEDISISSNNNYNKIDPLIVEKWGILSIANIPLIVRNRIAGALNIISKIKHSFTIHEKDLLLSIGREICTVIARIEAEEALKQSKKFFLDIFASIQDGICILDNNYNILQVNPTMKNWYSHINPVEGNKCYQLFYNRNEPCQDCVCLKVIESEKSFYKIINLVNANENKSHILEVFTFPLRNQETGKITGIVEYLRDISEQSETKAKLIESEVKSRNILENMKEGYFEVDLQGNFLFFNESLRSLLGYEYNKLIGLNFNRFVEKETNIKIREFFYNIYKTDIPQTGFQFEIINFDKKKSFIETSVYLRYNSDGKKIGFCGILRDITDKVKADRIIKEEIKKLKEIDKIKNEFVYRASHELKTPLNSINSASSLLLELYSNKLNKKILDLLEIIKKGGERLEYLIKDLLDISKIQSGKLVLNKKRENITRIIKQTISELNYLIEERNTNLNLNLIQDIYILIDKVRIEQLFMNLLNNALKYTPPKGEISINVKILPESIEISVKDNGLGFTTEEKEKIFKRFGKIERYGNGSNVITEGSGLGLYISKEIVELHGGKIWVESEGRNKGSIFIVRLPLDLKKI